MKELMVYIDVKKRSTEEVIVSFTVLDWGFIQREVVRIDYPLEEIALLYVYATLNIIAQMYSKHAVYKTIIINVSYKKVLSLICNKYKGKHIQTEKSIIAIKHILRDGIDNTPISIKYLKSTQNIARFPCKYIPFETIQLNNGEGKYFL